MARISNKEQAIAYAAEHGIILTVEDRVNFDGDYAVEVWSLDSRLSEPNSYCHTYFARGNTEARAWADALAYMQDLAECPADCSCRDGSELDVWVCECCALMVRNGDESGCRDYYGHTHPTCDKSVTYADTEHTFEVGYFHTNCNGCGELIRTGGTLYAAIRLANN